MEPIYRSGESGNPIYVRAHADNGIGNSGSLEVTATVLGSMHQTAILPLSKSRSDSIAF
jgi:hypothetical protein